MFFLFACIEPQYAELPDAPTNAPEEESSDFWDSHGALQAGIQLNHVPEGDWTMGIGEGEEDWDDNHVEHRVILEQDIWVSQTEVTHEQWLAYMDYHPSEGDEFLYETDMECMDCPVHSVSWDEILAFANAVSEYHGLEACFDCEGEGPDVQCFVNRDPYSCEGYRMPTEAEWEWAAIGGEGFTFPGSDDIDAIGWWEENSGMQSYPVCSKQPNGYGLCDMGGNIREFTLDWQAPYQPGTFVNPYVGPDQGFYAAERGGSWACRRPELKVDRRNLVWGYTRDIHSGFRLARTVHVDE